MSRDTGDTGPGALLPVRGVALASTRAGIKASGNPDLALVRLDAGSRTAAVFTRNAFCAAPVHVARRHLEAEPARLLVINSGCANAGTGAAGERDAVETCRYAAQRLVVDPEAVLPFSTGVIGQPLPMERLKAGIDACSERFDTDAAAWAGAAEAIMTTDTRAKGCSRRVRLAGGEVTVTGIAKGSGMIRPDMATMLAFVCTDAAVDRDALEAMLRDAVDASFHCITVDGDTSTNDAVTLTATGAGAVSATETDDLEKLGAAVGSVCLELAQAVVRDAEGVTRMIEIEVHGGRDREECRAVAFTVAHSPLVKTAVFGGDPNWGRILAAVGRAPLVGLDVAGVSIALDDIELVAAGQPVDSLDETAAANAMSGKEVRIRIGLGRGDAVATIWTSDLSYDYVRINADYRT